MATEVGKEKVEVHSRKRLSSAMENMLNTQIQREFESAMLYLSMSQFLNYNGWFNAAKLYSRYHNEELGHAYKMQNYLQDRDALPVTPAASEQPREYVCIKDVLQKTYDHEVQVSDWINSISKAAMSEGDLTTFEFFAWFRNEQIEEEAKALYWIDRIQMYEAYGKPIGDLDEEIGEYMEED